MPSRFEDWTLLNVQLNIRPDRPWSVLVLREPLRISTERKQCFAARYPIFVLTLQLPFLQATQKSPDSEQSLIEATALFITEGDNLQWYIQGNSLLLQHLRHLQRTDDTHNTIEASCIRLSVKVRTQHYSRSGCITSFQATNHIAEGIHARLQPSLLHPAHNNLHSLQILRRHSQSAYPGGTDLTNAR
ncbi:hypothetical protein D1872_255630 [compost metagenome]